jgi:hypothetical protein
MLTGDSASGEPVGIVPNWGLLVAGTEVPAPTEVVENRYSSRLLRLPLAEKPRVHRRAIFRLAVRESTWFKAFREEFLT